MSWCKLDDTLHGHPKALEAGLEAMGFWVLCLSHCGAYLTDGHVRRSVAARIAGDRLEELVARLVAVRLWEPHPSGDGWQVHDYLEVNPSRDQVLADRVTLSEKRAAAGREGAARRWQRDGKPMATPVLPMANGWQNDGPDPTRPVPDPGPTRPGDPPSRSLRSRERPPGGANGAERGARIPEEWMPSESVIAWAASRGVDALACLDEFRDYWRAIPGKSGRKTDWNATFRRRIRDLEDRGRAPMLPPSELDPSAPEIVGNPVQAANVADTLTALAKAKRPHAAGNGTAGGPHG